MDTPSGRTRVALLFGGRSGEHDVSVVSARSVHRALDTERYEIVPMAIDRDGLWADEATSQRILNRSGDRADAVMAFHGTSRLDRRLVENAIDVVFPVLHGPFGEDGTVQGMLELLDLPYVGCDTTSSAVCMDKGITKRLLRDAGLPTPPWVELDRWTWESDRDRVARACLDLSLPLFVKPSRLGSSVGISKVSEEHGLEQAVDAALSHGERVVVECGLDAREIEVAVLGNAAPRASVPGEVVPGHEFYDYADKYLDDACELLAPANLDPSRADDIRDLAVRVFQLLGCQGMARVDLFLERDTDAVWVNEVNTIPGFTSISMYPRLWGLTGLPYPDLVDELVRLALERHRQR